MDESKHMELTKTDIQKQEANAIDPKLQDEPEFGATSGDSKRFTWFLKVFAAIATILSLFQLYTAQFGVLTGLRQRAVHITFVLALTFMIKPFSRKKQRVGLPPFYDWVCILLSLASGIYIIYMDRALSARSGTVTQWDIVFGVIMVIMIIEATRRLMGPALPILASFMLFYTFFGNYFPGIVAHRGYSIKRMVSYIYLGTEGIFGTGLNMSSTVIAIFVIFGAVLKYSGTGDFISDIAISAFGRVRGGPAKVAIVASTLFGTMSGSAVANVVATGSFSIPLMIRVGYPPAFAGAVEAVASTGGQLMPPIMGATAFVIAEILGVSYLKICLAAFVPALLYYSAVFIQVDMRAVRLGMAGLPPDQLPDWKKVLKEGWYLFAPVIVLVVLLPVWSPVRVGFWAIVSAVALSWLRLETRMEPKKIYQALVDGGKGMLEVGAACAVSGILVGVFGLTGLGLKFSGVLLELAGGNLLALLVLTMISCIILGMGMSTLPVYLILAVLVAPALIKLNVPPISAHLFIFYFGIISAITPPVAIAAYAGASLAKENPMKVGFIACRLGLAAFLLPYMFVFGPALILEGTPLQIVQAIITAVIGVTALAAACEGYLFGELKVWQRIVSIVASLLLISTGLVTDVIGLVLFMMVIATAKMYGQKAAAHKMVDEVK